MAYHSRYHIVYDGCFFHVTWQCHNREWLLSSDDAKLFYYALLLKYKKKYGVTIHSYCFMSNHPHLTGQMRSREEFSNFFRVVNNLFARFYNKHHNRRGQVIMDRFKSPVIQSDLDMLRVMIYIDLNPVRQHMVAHPKEYLFTSYHYYAHGCDDPLLDPSPSYLALGQTPRQRQRAYREMVGHVLISEGFAKKNYSAVCFIGEPEWVVQKYQELQAIMQMKRPAKKERDTSHPPAS